MLAYLTVRNFALVANLELHFVDGLTVITGESGAGKSILLDALGLVLGQRASRSQIRPNSQECEVCAEFDLSNAPLSQQLLAANGLQDKDDANRCVVRRIASVDGRSRAWVNASPVSLGTLRELCSSMVAIHDQFAQQQLLGATTQLSWFDDFVAQPRLVETVKTSYREWRAHSDKYESERQRINEARERRELLQYQIEELDAFQLQEHEFEQLSTRYKRLNQTQSILAAVGQALDALEQNHNPGIGRTRSELDKVDDTSPELNSARELLDGVEVGIDESIRQLRVYSEALTTDEDSLDEVAARLDEIHDLARKHRVQSADLYTKAMELHEELNSLNEDENQLVKLRESVSTAREAYQACAKELTQLRTGSSKPFAASVIATLNEIGMRQAKFEVAFAKSEGETGLESVDFAVSANSRYDPGPLKAIASGGELSRISLAILVVVASNSKLPCLILDEADIGVGGTTADDVGRMLRRLAAHTQVVCVTHAPQVAALGDAHLRVLKTHEQDVAACELTGKDRVEEIARMVAGHRINEESRKYASVLLEEAQESNQTQRS
ncbi:MAG: DNA repair protein RecN [Gammaproteobacteria bacterium]|nr:DNA repair protein RecN [Gammaproteobacteria bacterium]